MKKLLGAAGATVAAGLTLAAPAHADPASEVAYLQQLTGMGIQIYDATVALTTGYMICNALNHVNGEQAAQGLFATAPRTETPTIDWARAWVVAAADTLCPWQYNLPTPRQFLV